MNIVGRINELYQIQAQDETYKSVENKLFLILIDEVELHYYIQNGKEISLNIWKIFNYKEHPIKFQFVIATHSPFVVSEIYITQI